MSRRGFRAIWLLGLALALILIIPAAAAAQDNSAADKKALELLDRGELAASDGRFDEAEKLWREALTVKPGWAKAEARLKDLDRRRREFGPRQEERHRRRQARLDFVQGVTLFNRSQFPEAAEHFQRYLKVFPNDERAQGYLAMARRESAQADQGTLWLDCRPEAEVWLDGDPAGKTPLEVFPVSAGLHKVKFAAYGAKKSFELNVEPRAKTSFVCTLEGAKLTVSSQPNAEITLNDQPLGETPLIAENLPVGPRRVTAQLPGYEPQTKLVILRADEPKELSFRLKPR